MNINFGYKIYDTEELLGAEKYLDLVESVKRYEEEGADLENILTPTYFLKWSDRIQQLFQTAHPEEYTRIMETQEFTYSDYLKMCDINKMHGVHHVEGEEYTAPEQLNIAAWDYFNFYLVDRKHLQGEKHSRTLGILQQAGAEIIKQLYNKVPAEHEGLFDHMNIYPKGSFISRHRDGQPLPPNPQRIFTLLFFLNTGRTTADGSLLNIYTEDGVVQVVPDISRVVLLEHLEYDYAHEVTENLSEKIRYTMYTPFYAHNYDRLLEM